MIVGQPRRAAHQSEGSRALCDREDRADHKNVQGGSERNSKKVFSGRRLMYIRLVAEAVENLR